MIDTGRLGNKHNSLTLGNNNKSGTLGTASPTRIPVENKDWTVIYLATRICSKSGAKWTIPRYKREWQDICALIPSYLEDGTNGTAITYLDNSKEFISYRLQWVLDDLLGYLRTNRAVLVKQSRGYLGKQARRVPLLASPDLCLVPVKGRERISRSDTAAGYVVLRYVEDVIPCSSGNRVYFSGGTYITVYDTTRTLWANLNLAKEMKTQLLWETAQLHHSA